MDNFRRPKRPNQHDTIDGFTRSRNSSVGATSRRIGDFSRKEGFTPRKTDKMPDGRSLGRKPKREEPKPVDIDMTDIDLNPKKKKRSRKTGSSRLKRAASGLLILLLLIGGFLGFKAFLRARQIFQGGGEALAWDCNLDPSLLTGEGDGRVNFLLMGKGGPEQTDGPDLTDTIMIASIDPCNKEAGLLSIPRDLAVKMESGETSKINAVYALTKMSAEANGTSEEDADKQGIDAIEKIVEEVSGIPIHFYAMIDYRAFEQAVDAVGGVDVNVEEPVFENMLIHGKPYTLDVEKGTQYFDGLRALAYSRSRYTSARGDFSRSERQRELIVALREKIFSLGTFSNPIKISQLMDSFGGRVTTNIGVPDDVSKLYNVGQEIDASRIKSVSLVDEPNVLIQSGSFGGLGSIQVPVAGIHNYEEINKFVRTTFVDGFIKSESPEIVILNGTTVPSLAKRKSEELKGYGYNVVQEGDAPNKDVTSTILVDLKKKDTKYTKRYLELRFGTTAVTDLPDGITPPETADFVIIVGQNEAGS